MTCRQDRMEPSSAKMKRWDRDECNDVMTIYFKREGMTWLLEGGIELAQDIIYRQISQENLQFTMRWN
jgi:hypothetical protein